LKQRTVKYIKHKDVEYRKKMERIAMQKAEAEKFREKVNQEIIISVGLHFQDWFRKNTFHCYTIYFKHPISPEEFISRLRKGFGELKIGFKENLEKKEKT